MSNNFNDFFANQSALNSHIVPTLSEQKAALLAQKLVQKSAKVDPNKAAEDSAKSVYDDITGSNSLDAMQSSFMQTGGRIFDMGANIYNRGADQFGYDPYQKTDAVGSVVDKWSDEEYANKSMGYDPREYNKSMQEAYNDVAKGDYLGAIGIGASNFGETLARSSGSMAELAAGTALAPATGGSSLFGVMGVLATKAPKLAKLVEAGYTPIKGALLYGSDQANQYAEAEYAKTGVKQSSAEVLSNTLIASVLGAVDLNIFKGVAKTGSLGVFKQTAVDLVKTANPTKKTGKIVAQNIAQNAVKIAGSGGAEAAQEYLETWHQILSSSDESITKQLTNEVNQNQALTGAAIGFGTAGTVVGIPATASSVAIGTLNAGREVSSRVVKKAHSKIAEQNYQYMSQEDRDTINKKQEETKKQFDDTINANNIASERILNADSINTLKSFKDPEIDKAIDEVLGKDKKIGLYKDAIKSATDMSEIPNTALIKGYIKDIKDKHTSKVPLTLDELKDKLITKLNDNYTDTDLNANLDKIKNTAIAQYNEKNGLLQAGRKLDLAKDVTGAVASHMYTKSKEALDKLVPKDTRDEIIRQAEKGVDLAKVGLDVTLSEVKNLDKSAARGVIDDISKGKINDVVKSYSKEQLKTLKKGFAGNEKAQKAIDNLIVKKDKLVGEWDSYLKNSKDKSILDSVVDAYGNVANTELAFKLKGLAEMSKESLFDSENLTKYKALVKDLEKEKSKNPDNFSPADKARLKKAYVKIAEAKNNGEQKLISETIKKLRTMYAKGTKSKKSKDIVSRATRKIRALGKVYTAKAGNVLADTEETVESYLKRVEEYDLEGKLDTVLDDMSKQLSKEGVDTSKDSEFTDIKKDISKKKETKKESTKKKPKSNETIKDRYTNLDITNREEILDLVNNHRNEAAQNLTFEQLDAMQKSNDIEIQVAGVELLIAKTDPEALDEQISTLPDRPLTTEEQNSDEVMKMAKLICKEK